MKKKVTGPKFVAFIFGIFGLFLATIIYYNLSYFPFSPDNISLYEYEGYFILFGILIIIGLIYLFKPSDASLKDCLTYLFILGWFGPVIGLLIIYLFPIVLCMTIGSISGIILAHTRKDIKKLSDIKEKGLSYPILGAIVGALFSSIGWVLENEFFSNMTLVLLFVASGYGIGMKRAEKRRIIEDKKRKKEQKEKRRRERMKREILDKIEEVTKGEGVVE